MKYIQFFYSEAYSRALNNYLVVHVLRSEILDTNRIYFLLHGLFRLS